MDLTLELKFEQFERAFKRENYLGTNCMLGQDVHIYFHMISQKQIVYLIKWFGHVHV